LRFAIKETAGKEREIFVRKPGTNAIFKSIIKPFEFLIGSVKDEPNKS